jgi:hypothetical protein
MAIGFGGIRYELDEQPKNIQVPVPSNVPSFGTSAIDPRRTVMQRPLPALVQQGTQGIIPKGGGYSPDQTKFRGALPPRTSGQLPPQGRTASLQDFITNEGSLGIPTAQEQTGMGSGSIKDPRTGKVLAAYTPTTPKEEEARQQRIQELQSTEDRDYNRKLVEEERASSNKMFESALGEAAFRQQLLKDVASPYATEDVRVRAKEALGLAGQGGQRAEQGVSATNVKALSEAQMNQARVREAALNEALSRTGLQTAGPLNEAKLALLKEQIGLTGAQAKATALEPRLKAIQATKEKTPALTGVADLIALLDTAPEQKNELIMQLLNRK